MNAGDLIRERDRLLDVIEEGKSARLKLKRINELITIYAGNDAAVELVKNGIIPESGYCVLGDGQPIKYRGLCNEHYNEFAKKRLTPEQMALVPSGKTHSGARTKKAAAERRVVK
jgi:hypothetical protein